MSTSEVRRRIRWPAYGRPPGTGKTDARSRRPTVTGSGRVPVVGEVAEEIDDVVGRARRGCRSRSPRGAAHRCRRRPTTPETTRFGHRLPGGEVELDVSGSPQQIGREHGEVPGRRRRRGSHVHDRPETSPAVRRPATLAARTPGELVGADRASPDGCRQARRDERHEPTGIRRHRIGVDSPMTSARRWVDADRVVEARRRRPTRIRTVTRFGTRLTGYEVQVRRERPRHLVGVHRDVAVAGGCGNGHVQIDAGDTRGRDATDTGDDDREALVGTDRADRHAARHPCGCRRAAPGRPARNREPNGPASSDE